MKGSQLYSVDVPLNNSDKWRIIRNFRNSLLLKVEWTQSEGATITEGQVLDAATYIQALKDIPQSFDSPDDVVFPDPPEFLKEWVNL